MIHPQQASDQPLALQPALLHVAQAAAVLLTRCEVFDQQSLAELTGQADAALLVAAGLAWSTGTGYVLEPSVAQAAQAALDADPQRERELHGLAAAYYLPLLGGHAGAEAAYMHHLSCQCEALIHQQPADLAEAVASAPIGLLVERAHRYLLRYYAALGAGLCGQIEGARVQLDSLLAETDLDDTVRGRALNSAAIFARQQGDYEQALAGYRTSQAIWERLGNVGRHGLALLNQGILHYELQDYPAAEAELRASLPLFETAGIGVHAGSAHNELGLVCRDQGRWQEAQQHFNTCVAIWEREAATERLGFATINIGELALLRGRYMAALDMFARALDLLGEQAYTVEAHVNLGLLAQARGDDRAALKSYGRALTLAQQVGYRERIALIHARLGHSHARLGDAPAASAAYAAAVAAVEATRAPLRSEGLLISLMGRWQQVYEAQMLHALDQDELAVAFESSERARARAFADLLGRGPRTEDREPRTGTGDTGDWRLATEPISLVALQAALPPGGLLLSYFATGLRGPESALLDQLPPEAVGLRTCLDAPTRLLCFAVTRDTLRVHRCALDPNMLHSTSPRRADGRRFLQPAILRQLYDELIAPVADLVAASTSVQIVPHGPLHQLPFAALLDPAGTPLIEAGACLTYTPSATVWLHTAARRRLPTAERQLLALGYDGAGEATLRHTEAEAAALAAMCGGTLWHGEPKIVGRLMAGASAYRWLHLACHGTFDLAEPLQSALHLGPHEQLTAADVLAHLRLNAELVTLSACRSGVSKVLRGDEPLGLVRAFLGAGAQSVLVTLWPVEDTSARLLMERLYAHMLQRGQTPDTHHDASPAAALRAAQCWLRTLTPTDLADQLRAWGSTAPPITCADPQIWAAYVLVGA